MVFLKNFFDQLIYFENSYQIIFILSVFSYLYYIGFEENIIDGKIKECAQSILKNSDVRNSYINLQYLIYEKICNNWDIKIYESLLSLIKKYEVPERYGALKCSNIEEVILKFYIFIITSIAYCNDDMKVILSCLDYKIVEEYLKSNKESSIKNTFQTNYEILLDNNEKNENIQETYYSFFTNPFKEIIKKEMKKKVNGQFNEKNVIEKIKQVIFNTLNDDFVIDKNNKKNKNSELFEIELINQEYSVNELNDCDFPKMGIKKIFYDELFNILVKNNCLEIQNRIDNQKLINYLEERKYDFIFGKKTVISPINYDDKRELDSYIRKK